MNATTPETQHPGFSKDVVRELAAASIAGDASPADIDRFVEREIRDLLASPDAASRELGRLYATGFRRDFIRWNSAVSDQGTAPELAIAALELAIAVQVIEVASGYDLTPGQAQDLVCLMMNRTLRKAVIGVQGSLAARALLKRGDA